MNLHGQIMNLQTPSPLSFGADESAMHCYKRGHRDARHAAAELALAADAEIERLRADSDLLAWVLAHPETCAEVLEDAAAGEGEGRALLEQRRAGLTLNVRHERQKTVPRFLSAR